MVVYEPSEGYYKGSGVEEEQVVNLCSSCFLLHCETNEAQFGIFGSNLVIYFANSRINHGQHCGKKAPENTQGQDTVGYFCFVRIK